MKVAIIQPYFFPYLGYFQIMNLVDTFVVYDDVNYIKQGWINRNRILLKDSSEKMVTLSLKKASSFKLINETNISDNKQQLLKTILSTYEKAPYSVSIAELLNNCFKSSTENLSDFLTETLIQISAALHMDTKIVLSSELEKDNTLKGENKVIEICRKLGATQYINSIGGQSLYSSSNFAKNNLDLKFLNCIPKPYTQHNENTAFVPGLSIIDPLMFTGIEGLKTQLSSFELV